MLYPKDLRAKLSEHFNVSEFVCKCDSCDEILVDQRLVDLLERVREHIGAALVVTSGYRCANYQAELKLRGYETAIGPSEHEFGRAADIMSEGKTGAQLAEAAEKAGFEAIGIGSVFIHVDLRTGKRRRWTYARG